MSQYQLVPYKRIEEDFQDQVKIPISAGTVFNFNYDAYHKLEAFEAMVKSKLIASGLCHADKTGININGKRVWLHCVSNPLWSYYLPHEKRGLEAMEAMGILPHFNGVLCQVFQKISGLVRLFDGDWRHKTIARVADCL